MNIFNIGDLLIAFLCGIALTLIIVYWYIRYRMNKFLNTVIAFQKDLAEYLNKSKEENKYEQ